MKIDVFLSDKIKVLSLFSIILVLYIHSGFHTDELEKMMWIMTVQNYISSMIGRIAVPLFYMISGYLFYLNTPKGIHTIFNKIKKRISSLLLPYIFSSIFFIAFGVFVAITPGTSQFMNSTVLPLFDNDSLYIIKATFWGINGSSPIAFHLWFLRDLLILVLLSPIWYYLFKYLKVYWIIVIFVLTFYKISFFPIIALFWFSLGGAFVNLKFTRLKNKSLSNFLVLFLFIGFFQIMFPSSIWYYVHIPITFLGIISFWVIYDIVLPQNFTLSNYKYLTIACSFTFFIYLYHEPTLNIVRKLIVFILGKNEFGFIISYLSSPWVFIALFIPIGLIMKKFFPKVYYVIAGGR